jgi:hypothetical protein
MSCKVKGEVCNLIYKEKVALWAMIFCINFGPYLPFFWKIWD